MTEPWFDPNLYSWIPGTLLGVAGGTLGGVAGALAPRGKARSLVLGLFAAAALVSFALLVTGLVALLVGQPYGVWYGLGLPGLIGSVLFVTLFPVLRARYREAETRRIHAADLV
jgi:hypothetical protein